MRLLQWMRRWLVGWVALVVLGVIGWGSIDARAGELKGESSRGKARSVPQYALSLEKAWPLDAPGGERFDASGLLWSKAGGLLTVNDRGAGVYRIDLGRADSAASLPLVRQEGWFTQPQLELLRGEKVGRYDIEGIGEDDEGRIYLCEESNRWILRLDPVARKVVRLPIDWAPVRKYFSTDLNASFEGVAVGGGRLYVANERSKGRILVVDLAGFKVVDDFAVHPPQREAGDHHYTDLCWAEGSLWVLLREGHCVLRVDPATHKTLAEFDFRAIETDPRYSFRSIYPTGSMEGLAVRPDAIWLVTDNNGAARVSSAWDHRPLLFKCARPDRGGSERP